MPSVVGQKTVCFYMVSRKKKSKNVSFLQVPRVLALKACVFTRFLEGRSKNVCFYVWRAARVRPRTTGFFVVFFVASVVGEKRRVFMCFLGGAKS